eukprot:TRINITY_DN19835_c0_g1_i1.p2 TRINITY_DN19835_c0_g1~~TRINITY_DN19835_c0_g1_i1.p2  ORF type:complete len:137 (-),score=40.87 TRINITY_DN19835_c0_g1_i1:411-821(-)
MDPTTPGPICAKLCLEDVEGAKQAVRDGADVNESFIAENDERMFPLAFAAAMGDTELCEFLLDNKADIDQETMFYASALTIAIIEGGPQHANVAKLLIGRGARTDITCQEHGRTPLDWAEARDLTEVVELLKLVSE